MFYVLCFVFCVFKPNSVYAVRLQCTRLFVCLSVCLSVCVQLFGHQTSSTIVSSHSKLKQHPAYEFGHQTSSTVVSSHSKLKQHPAYEFGGQIRKLDVVLI